MWDVGVQTRLGVGFVDIESLPRRRGITRDRRCGGVFAEDADVAALVACCQHETVGGGVAVEERYAHCHAFEFQLANKSIGMCVCVRPKDFVIQKKKQRIILYDHHHADVFDLPDLVCADEKTMVGAAFPMPIEECIRVALGSCMMSICLDISPPQSHFLFLLTLILRTYGIRVEGTRQGYQNRVIGFVACGGL